MSHDHSHGEDAATSASNKLQTSRIFSDGYSLQMAKVTGSVVDGYVAALIVPV